MENMNNLSEEEKRAIEYLKNRLEILHNNIQWATENSIKIVLNLIKRQQKEIEELNEIKQQICNEELITQDYVQQNFISKDKIKKILGIEEDIEEEKILSLLQTIVAEFNRLEDIEDRKVEVAVDNIEKKRDKYWKDKIREVIGTPYPEIAIDNLLKLLEK